MTLTRHRLAGAQETPAMAVLLQRNDELHRLALVKDSMSAFDAGRVGIGAQTVRMTMGVVVEGELRAAHHEAEAARRRKVEAGVEEAAVRRRLRRGRPPALPAVVARRGESRSRSRLASGWTLAALPSRLDSRGPDGEAM